MNLNESGKNQAPKNKNRNEKIVLQEPESEYRASSKNPQQMNSNNIVQESVLTKGSKSPEPTHLPVNYDVHIFYYPWYGNPEHDGKYFHWNHPYIFLTGTKLRQLNGHRDSTNPLMTSVQTFIPS